ncbi:TniQ family protein [Kitasatospora sp. NBC_01287]|uniref:TniQ family protein n=1 Tax=Kitasatospora sp. NBC_01287 TaxID=2903573 RepID=UPI0022550277|nr:TniQ family protein [Kitasatospora sp. NBC_01287]MCX4745190.1 TniQ family protein [Kitasatospora sp. NBC_01287]
MATAPLPRSLDPLPDESVAGYVLRLSHRLNVPPGWLMYRTGLTGPRSPNYSNAGLSIAMSDDIAAEFARTTRLSLEEVTALTLACFNGRYPPVTRAMSASVVGRRPSETWLFQNSSRYCPDCLAGGGSPIQDAHGGSWKKIWQLPVVFACLEHRCYLRHQCFDCRRPISGDGGGRLLARAGDPSLHPLQCRNSLPGAEGERSRTDPACGGRLDRRPSLTAPTLMGRDMALQARMLRCLGAETSPREAAEYFTDLQLVTSLICVTWPLAESLAPRLAAHTVNSFLRRRAAQLGSNHWFQRFTALPVDATEAAALLEIAAAVLDSEDLAATLGPLVLSDRTQGRRAVWSEHFIRQAAPCSSRFSQAVAPLTHAVHGSHRRDTLPQSAGHGGFAPEHVPAYLPKLWLDEHFRRCEGISERLLRRTASVRLAQLTAQGSLDEAAEYLGIEAPRRASGGVQRWAHAKLDVFEFENALRDLAIGLDATVAWLVDYQHRREALKDWHLDQRTWDDLTASIPQTGTVEPRYDDLKRHVASIFVWTRITQGEHLFAPRPLETAQAIRTRQYWETRRNTMWSLLANPGVSPHFTLLGEALTEYADRLAATIDAERSARQMKHSLAN